MHLDAWIDEMSSAGMVQVRRGDTEAGSCLMASVHSLWETKTNLDGMIICRDGCVPFSRLLLASHSQLLRELFISHETEGEEVQKIILGDFR